MFIDVFESDEIRLCHHRVFFCCARTASMDLENPILSFVLTADIVFGVVAVKQPEAISEFSRHYCEARRDMPWRPCVWRILPKAYELHVGHGVPPSRVPNV